MLQMWNHALQVKSCSNFEYNFYINLQLSNWPVFVFSLSKIKPFFVHFLFFNTCEIGLTMVNGSVVYKSSSIQ